MKMVNSKSRIAVVQDAPERRLQERAAERIRRAEARAYVFEPLCGCGMELDGRGLCPDRACKEVR